MKRIISSLVIIGFALIIQGCAIYASFYEYLLVPKLQLGNSVQKAPASRLAKLELGNPRKYCMADMDGDYLCLGM
jgi:hypothetical protein